MPIFLALYPLKLLEVPEVVEPLTNNYPHFPCNKSFPIARQEPLVVLYTLGITSYLKLIIWIYDYAASLFQ